MSLPHDVTRASELASALEGEAIALRPDAPPVRLRVAGLHVGPLASFPHGPARDAGDLRASLVAPLSKCPALVAVLSFAPEDALALLRSQGPAPRLAGEALAWLRQLGAGLLGHARAALEAAPADGGFEDAPLDAPRVVEEPLVSTVIATHPPPETRVVTAKLEIVPPGLPALLLLLGPGKL